MTVLTSMYLVSYFLVSSRHIQYLHYYIYYAQGE